MKTFISSFVLSSLFAFSLSETVAQTRDWFNPPRGGTEILIVEGQGPGSKWAVTVNNNSVVGDTNTEPACALVFTWKKGEQNTRTERVPRSPPTGGPNFEFSGDGTERLYARCVDATQRGRFRADILVK